MDLGENAMNEPLGDERSRGDTQKQKTEKSASAGLRRSTSGVGKPVSSPDGPEKGPAIPENAISENAIPQGDAKLAVAKSLSQADSDRDDESEMEDSDNEASIMSPGSRINEGNVVNGPPKAGGVFGDLFAEVGIAQEGYDMPLSAEKEPNELTDKMKMPMLRLTLAACSGSFLFGYSVSGLNVALNHVLMDLSLCGEQGGRDCLAAEIAESSILTSLFLGAACGAITAPYLQKRGRKYCMICSLYGFSFGAITSAVASSLGAMLWGRLVTGWAVGTASVAVPTYLAEMMPPSVRGRFGSISQIMIVIGILGGVLIGLPLNLKQPVDTVKVPGDLSKFSRAWWRVVAASPLLFAISGLFALTQVYAFETPHYYVGIGKINEARAVLQFLHAKENVTREVNETATEVLLQHRAAKDQDGQLSLIFKKKENRKMILIGCLLALLQQLTGINYYVSTSTQLFLNVGASSSSATLGTMVIFIVNVLVTLPSPWLLDRYGRRRLLIIGSFGEFLALFPSAVVLWMEDVDPTVKGWVSIASIMAFLIFFAISFGPVLWVYLFEMFPLAIKDRAASIAVSINWLGAIVVVLLSTIIPPKWIYSAFSFIALAGAFLCAALIRETRGRKLGNSPYQ